MPPLDAPRSLDSSPQRIQHCHHLQVTIENRRLIRLGWVIPHRNPLVLDLTQKILRLRFLAESMHMFPRAILFHKIDISQLDPYCLGPCLCTFPDWTVASVEGQPDAARSCRLL